MNIFLTEKVTGPESHKNPKSHGTILDNNAIIGIQGSGDHRQTYEASYEVQGIESKELIPIPLKFSNKFPKLSSTKQKKHFDRYLSVMRNHLLKRLPFMNNEYTHISLVKLINECGEFQYEKKRYYIWNEFKETYPFFYVVDTGSNLKYTNNLFEKNSKVKIMNYKLIDMLIDASDTKELVSLFYGSINDDTVLTTVDVDMNSLCNFISHCDVELSNPAHSTEYKNQIRKNRYQAKYTKLISEFFYDAYDKYCFPMIPNKSDYGRTYYQGINLMNMKEEVRRAVLGDYHQYDLNAAVYAVKLMLAKNVLAENNESHYGKFTYTKEYLDRKSRLREELAKDCLKKMNMPFKGKVKIIKEAITAIGFGARIGAGSWQTSDNEWKNPALNDIIKTKEDRERFINHNFVKNFVKEQQDMMKLIVDHYLKDEEFTSKIVTIKNMVNNNGRIRKAQVMAYLYQSTETYIMENVKQIAGDNVISIHDALITKKQISNNTLLDIKQFLNELDSELTIDHEQKNGWMSVYEYEDDDPRDAYVRQMYKDNAKSFSYDVMGNYASYESTTQYEQLEEEDYY